MPATYSTVFRDALIHDGSGNPPAPGDLAVAGDRIIAIGPPGSIGRGEDEVDAKGLALAPGFIDAHTHDDRIVLDAPDMVPKISQGVTTVVAGNCGISLVPVMFELGARQPCSLGDAGERRYRAELGFDLVEMSESAVT